MDAEISSTSSEEPLEFPKQSSPRLQAKLASKKKPTAIKAKVATTKTKTQKPKSRSLNFSTTDVANLLEIAGNVVPICSRDWDEIARQFNEETGTCERPVEALRRKFNTLANVRMPTGDPNLPPNVAKAKSILFELSEKADAAKDGKMSPEELGIAAADEDNNLDDVGQTSEVTVPSSIKA